MPEPLSRLRLDVTKSVLRDVENFLAKYTEMDFSPYKNGDGIKDCLSGLKRAAKEFEANLFLVVVVGPLKAGKSTMVNCLAREYVSPTEFGKECTKRPAIILQAERGEDGALQTGIDEYFLTNTQIDRDNGFNIVIDYLRGMIDEAEFKQIAYRETSPLTKEFLAKKLSNRQLAREPLITVIRVPGGKLINKDTALLDTPGFDGRDSNFRESPIHQWIMKRADFIIFIQSSIAALNFESEDFLYEIKSNSRKPPFWLVQNFIDARHWRAQEERDQETMNQKAEAIKAISACLGIGEHELPSIAINLGKAWDGIEKPDPALLAESTFESLEAMLHKTLETQRVAIQEKNCVNGLLEAINTAGSRLHELAGRIAQFNKVHEQALAAVDDCISQIGKVKYDCRESRNDFARELEKISGEQLGKWLATKEQKVEAFCNANNRETSGKTLNEGLEELANRIRQDGQNLYFNPAGPLGATLRELTTDIITRIEEPTLQRVNQTLANLELDPIAIKPRGVENAIPRLDGGSFLVGKVPEKHHWFVTQKYSGGQVRAKVEDLATDIAARLHERVNRWNQSVQDVFFAEFCEARRQALTIYLQDKKNQLVEANAREVERSNNSLGLIREMEQQLSSWRQMTREAAAAAANE
jgi:GTPase SAR1 family protein